MTMLNDKDFYRTTDLALAAVLSLSYPLDAIDRLSRKSQFIFKREEGLDQLIENYWRGQVQVEPKAYFQELRVIKARLYSEE